MESVSHAALQTAEVRVKGRANVIHHDQNKAPRRVATVIMCVRCHNMCRAHVCGLSSSVGNARDWDDTTRHPCSIGTIGADIRHGTHERPKA